MDGTTSASSNVQFEEVQDDYVDATNNAQSGSLVPFVPNIAPSSTISTLPSQAPTLVGRSGTNTSDSPTTTAQKKRVHKIDSDEMDSSRLV